MSLHHIFKRFFEENTLQLVRIGQKLFDVLILFLLSLNLYDICYHLYWEGHLNSHQFIEATLFFLIFGIMIIIKLLSQKSIQSIQKEIFDKDQQLMIYKQKYKDVLQELKVGIEEQMKKWKFTDEEQKVAKLLILGYSFKEIAGLLNKSEKTVRNQSLVIYKKSGMIGRNDLAGYFLSDFLEIEE